MCGVRYIALGSKYKAKQNGMAPAGTCELYLEIKYDDYRFLCCSALKYYVIIPLRLSEHCCWDIYSTIFCSTSPNKKLFNISQLTTLVINIKYFSSFSCKLWFPDSDFPVVIHRKIMKTELLNILDFGEHHFFQFF